jgi:protein-S-isoprenylcysteine O-methyltransferase Ste14
VRPWLVAAIWLAWFVVAGGAGYARARSDDRIDERGTRISVRADMVTVVSMVGAVVVALWVPAAALPGDPWLALVPGVALVVLGLALRQWAAGTLGHYFTRSITIRAGHRVITSGPYRFVRHPGYAGILVSVVGLALTLGNWLSVALMVIGFLLAHIPRINAEEAALEANLGEQYRQFQRTRKRLIPGVW